MTVSWPRGYKTFFMLNLVEHEILNAHMYKDHRKFSTFSGSEKLILLLILFIIVGILTFMSKKNFMLNLIEHEKSFITSGPVGIMITFCLVRCVLIENVVCSQLLKQF